MSSDCLPGCVHSTSGKPHCPCESTEEASARITRDNARETHDRARETHDRDSMAYKPLQGKTCRDHCAHAMFSHTKCQTKEQYDAALLPIRATYEKAKRAAEDASDVEAERKWRAEHPDYEDCLGYANAFSIYERPYERELRHRALLPDWPSRAFGQREADILTTKTRLYDGERRDIEWDEKCRKAEEKKKQEEEEAEKLRKQKEADDRERAHMENVIEGDATGFKGGEPEIYAPAR